MNTLYVDLSLEEFELLRLIKVYLLGFIKENCPEEKGRHQDIGLSCKKKASEIINEDCPEDKRRQ